MIPTIALPFKHMPTQKQIKFAKKIVKRMSSDGRFKEFKSSVEELSRKILEWQLAIENARNGGKIKTIQKIEKGLTVMDKVFALASKVEILAEFDDSLIAAAGFKKQKKISFTKKAFSPSQIKEILVATA